MRRVLALLSLAGSLALGPGASWAPGALPRVRFTRLNVKATGAHVVEFRTATDPAWQRIRGKEHLSHPVAVRGRASGTLGFTWANDSNFFSMDVEGGDFLFDYFPDLPRPRVPADEHRRAAIRFHHGIFVFPWDLEQEGPPNLTLMLGADVELDTGGFRGKLQIPRGARSLTLELERGALLAARLPGSQPGQGGWRGRATLAFEAPARPGRPDRYGHPLRRWSLRGSPPARTTTRARQRPPQRSPRPPPSPRRTRPSPPRRSTRRASPPTRSPSRPGTPGESPGEVYDDLENEFGFD